jgi:hypothetical protein
MKWLEDETNGAIIHSFGGPMPVTRLLALSALLIACAGFAFAQAPESADLVVFRGIASMSVSDVPSVDQPAATSDSQNSIVATNQSADSLAQISNDRWRSHSISTFNRVDSDRTCLLIRSYLVVRDSPHSDSTHRDGYTTCVPAARFRMYTTVGTAHGDTP